MRLKPLVGLDLNNFTTFAKSLGWQGFQVAFQMSSQGWVKELVLISRGRNLYIILTNLYR